METRERVQEREKERERARENGNVHTASNSLVLRTISLLLLSPTVSFHSVMLPENKALYEEQWRFHAQYLNAAHAAGVYVLVDIGADPLASCLSGWEKGHEGALSCALLSS